MARRRLAVVPCAPRRAAPRRPRAGAAPCWPAWRRRPTAARRAGAREGARELVEVVDGLNRMTDRPGRRPRAAACPRAAHRRAVRAAAEHPGHGPRDRRQPEPRLRLDSVVTGSGASSGRSGWPSGWPPTAGRSSRRLGARPRPGPAPRARELGRAPSAGRPSTRLVSEDRAAAASAWPCRWWWARAWSACSSWCWTTPPPLTDAADRGDRDPRDARRRPRWRRPACTRTPRTRASTTR